MNKRKNLVGNAIEEPGQIGHLISLRRLCIRSFMGKPMASGLSYHLPGSSSACKP